MKKVIVVGAGASGIMAAICAARAGAQVIVLESERKPLKKLLLTGNGRCNMTNMHWDGQVLRGAHADMAFAIVKNFDHNDAIAFFSEIGVHTKERDGWIYPMSDSAKNVARLLLHEAERLRITIKTNERVSLIEKEGEAFSIETANRRYEADRIIVSSGSSASVNGNAYTISEETAERFGIKRSEFLPALTALRTSDSKICKCSGVRCDGRISLHIDGRCECEKRGQLQFTSYGISGIPVFELGRYAVDGIRQGREVALYADLLPDLDVDELFKLLIAQRKRDPSASLKLILSGLLPEGIAALAQSACGDISDAVGFLKALYIPIDGYLKEDKAQACMGGIDIGELTAACEAKKCRGLYFTGEAVDVDGTCGGYNLQWAWSSGYAAGCAAAI